jgi:hypothetical protein
MRPVSGNVADGERSEGFVVRGGRALELLRLGECGMV